ncbi:MAG: filamentous hemagglutinin N-terminal domain-containing protein [Waterburya sp.]
MTLLTTVRLISQATSIFVDQTYIHLTPKLKVVSIFKRLSLFIACSVALIPADGIAQITPDGSVPTTVEQLENIMQINGGERAGNNLFHSFDEFSIPEGMEAVFENATDIENIFTRVTGDSVSNIDGVLSTQGNANFFFINPNGIVFGDNASLDVGGSFVASTAETIEFNDGSKFSARNENRPTITINFPIGLGLGSNPGAITVNGDGNQILSESNFSPTDLGNTESGLSLTPGKTLALIGSEVNFTGGIVTAEGGKIEISSLRSGSVGLQETENGLTFSYNDNAVSYQDINLSEQALLNTSGEGQGAISLTGKNVLLSDGSFILNQNRGNIDSGAININAIETLRLSGTSANGEISSSIRSQSLSRGQGGKIEINTKQLSVLDKGRISATTYSEAGGIDLKVNAIDSVKIADSSFNVSTFAEGNAGNLELITSDLQITDSGVVSSSTFSTGSSGKIDVQAKSIEIAGGSATERSNISATSFGSGNAGNLNIDTEQLKVQNGASVSSSGLAEGDAGSVVVNASKSVEVEGVNQNFKGNTPESTIRSAVIAATPAGRKAFGLPSVPTGNAGKLTISTPQLNILQQGVVSVRNDGTGSGGILSINAEEINLDNSGSITAASASGNGGDINIDGDNLQIDNESQITTEAGNNGDGGNITINTSNLIAKKNSNLTTSAVGGDGGNINITADTILGIENSDITANAVGGNGGNITITSDYLFGLQQRGQLTSQSDITASSEFGLDGTVTLNSPETLTDEKIAFAENINFTSTQDLIAQTCSADTAHQNVGTISNRGRGGIPESPDDYFDATVTSTPTVTPNRSVPSPVPVLDWQPGEPIIEANSVRIERDGSTSLIATPQMKSPAEQSCQPFSFFK